MRSERPPPSIPLSGDGQHMLAPAAGSPCSLRCHRIASSAQMTDSQSGVGHPPPCYSHKHPLTDTPSSCMLFSHAATYIHSPPSACHEHRQRPLLTIHVHRRSLVNNRPALPHATVLSLTDARVGTGDDGSGGDYLTFSIGEKSSKAFVL